MNECVLDEDFDFAIADYGEKTNSDEEKLFAEALLDGDYVSADKVQKERRSDCRADSASDIKSCFRTLVEKINLKDKSQVNELDLDRAVGNSALNGPLSRAVAVMREHIVSFNSLDPAAAGTPKRITAKAIELFHKLQADVATGKIKSKEAVAFVKQVDDSLSEADKLVRKAVRKAFANEETPEHSIKLECVRQSGVGNCYLYGAIGALVGADPGAIRRMIFENKDGSYSVKFPGRAAVKVDAPTDAEIYLYPKEGKHGTWMWILEKAYGKICMNDIRSIAFHAALFRRPGARPQEYTWGPGVFDEGIRALTGKKVEWATNLFPDVMKKTLGDLFQKPGQAVVTADATINVKVGKDAPVWGHTYSLLNYDKRTDEVTLRNPWGHGVPGTSGVKDLGDGKFSMKFKDFQTCFSRISYVRMRGAKQ